MQKTSLSTGHRGSFTRHPGIPRAGIAGRVQRFQRPAFIINSLFLFFLNTPKIHTSLPGPCGSKKQAYPVVSLPGDAAPLHRSGPYPAIKKWICGTRRSRKTLPVRSEPHYGGPRSGGCTSGSLREKSPGLRGSIRLQLPDRNTTTLTVASQPGSSPYVSVPEIRMLVDRD
jgi:hypothetical protein